MTAADESKYQKLVDRMIKDQDWTESFDDMILEPVTYFNKENSRNMATTFAEDLNYWFHVPDHKMKLLNEIADEMYSYTLCYDDIHDDTDVRKNRPTAHKVFGVPGTLNGFRLRCWLTLEKIMNNFPPEGVDLFKNLELSVARAHGIEKFFIDNSKCPTEEEYSKIRFCMCYTFFLLLARLMQLSSKNFGDIDIRPLAAIFSDFVAHYNDYRDFFEDEFNGGKNFCDDLTEGKFTVATIHAIKEMNNKEVEDIVLMKTRDRKIKQKCVDILNDIGSLEYARKRLKAIHSALKAEIAKFGGNPAWEKKIDSMMKQLDYD